MATSNPSAAKLTSAKGTSAKGTSKATTSTAPAKPARKKAAKKPLVDRMAAAKKMAAKKPDVGGQIDRLQKRSRDLEDWQEEVEDALAQGLNILVGGKREAAEKASEDAAEFEREQQHNAIETGA